MFETIIFPAVVAVAALMTALFLLSIIIKRNDIVDIAWGLGIFLISVVSYAVAPVKTTLGLIMIVLSGSWGIRLALRIHRRNRGKGEDFRYKAWREQWGNWVYVRSFFQIYVLQGFLMLVLGASFLHASYYSESFSGIGPLTIVGILVWIVGYFFEAIGDAQLDAFIADESNRGKIMDEGLWKYTRHPNYFGEVVMWWGIWLTVAALPMSYIALVSPLAITFLILKVSGIPMLEKKYDDNPAYQAYKVRTSKFFPMPQKKISVD